MFLLLMGWIASRVTDPRAVIHLASIGVLGGALSLIATHAMPGGPTIDGVVGLVLFMIATAILLMGVATATLLNGTVAAVALLACGALLTTATAANAVWMRALRAHRG